MLKELVGYLDSLETSSWPQIESLTLRIVHIERVKNPGFLPVGKKVKITIEEVD